MFKHITVLILILLWGCANRMPSKNPKIPEHATSDGTDTEENDTDSQLHLEKYLNTPATEDIIPPAKLVSEDIALGIDPDDLSLAKAIFKWKMKYDKGIWVECGVKYEGTHEIKKASIEWAKAINAAHKTATYKLRGGKPVHVNKKEVIGVMMNESRFDRCAVGPNPRKFAYKNGLLKRNSWHISHSLKEWKSVFTNPKFKGRKADLGGAQIVVRIGKNHTNWNEIKRYLSVVPGVQIIFDEMKRRGTKYSTKTPSDRWPGAQKHSAYTIRALRNASLIYKYL